MTNLEQENARLRDGIAMFQSQLHEANNEIDHLEFELTAADALAMAMERIAAWDFDIMGDCVADAQKLAINALREYREVSDAD